ncbi:MAG: ROK family protein [Actinobacteria bacterium]|jgi:polyphosphate glucokinase|nr:ROK family protein [Actinomycetota bacterium]
MTSPVMTLSIDCGGLSIKASVLDQDGTMHAPAVAVPTPYPLSPARLIEVFQEIASQLPTFDRITVGFPGMVRHGVVVHTPHYINVKGPRTRLDPELYTAWTGLDFRSLVEKNFARPTLMLNDAEVHGAGVVAGSGFEVVLTLGTGLGCAVFDGGKLAPHIELSHAPIRRSMNYDTWIGEHERRRLGDSFWSRRIRSMISDLRPVFHWDRLYLGGGNARRIKPNDLAALGDDVVIVPNAAGIVGGVRAWNLTRV